jgi:DNA-binding PadR family transcriptional regulator
MLEYIILGFLMKQEMSGYDIKQVMSKSTSNFFDASYGSIYPILKNLEKKTLITSNEIVDSGKYKKVYKINEQGENEFLKWLEQPIELSRNKHSYLIKIFFYGLLTKDKAKLLISNFIEELKRTLDELEKLEPAIREMADYFQLSTFDFGRDYYKFTIKWFESYFNSLSMTD